MIELTIYVLFFVAAPLALFGVIYMIQGIKANLARLQRTQDNLDSFIERRG